MLFCYVLLKCPIILHTFARLAPVFAFPTGENAFPDPGETRPDRPMAAYLHFGGGLHPCAGRVVNAIQIPLLVGTLLDAGARPDGAMKWVGPFPDRIGEGVGILHRRLGPGDDPRTGLDLDAGEHGVGRRLAQQDRIVRPAAKVFRERLKKDAGGPCKPVVGPPSQFC